MEYQRLAKELKAYPITDMPNDAIIPRYIFEKKFTVLFPTREYWKNDSQLRQGSGSVNTGNNLKICYQ